MTLPNGLRHVVTVKRSIVRRRRKDVQASVQQAEMRHSLCPGADAGLQSGRRRRHLRLPAPLQLAVNVFRQAVGRREDPLSRRARRCRCRKLFKVAVPGEQGVQDKGVGPVLVQAQQADAVHSHPGPELNGARNVVPKISSVSIKHVLNVNTIVYSYN